MAALAAKCWHTMTTNCWIGAGDGYRRGGLPGRIGHRERDTGRFDEPRYILGACGGAAIYRQELFQSIGYLDDDYFAYLEDVDFGLRAQTLDLSAITFLRRSFITLVAAPLAVAIVLLWCDCRLKII